MNFRQLTCALALSTAMTAAAQGNIMEINTKKVGAPVQPTMYGMFFEDINYAADGGLYAELVKNRSFDFPYAFTGWQVAGNVEVRNDGPFDRNPNYVRLKSSGHGHKWTALLNEGFFGIGVEQDKEYRFTFYARVPEGKNRARIRMELAQPITNREGQDFLSREINIEGSEWKQYEVVVKSPMTEPKAQLRIFLLGNNAVDLEHISLFPVDTWKGRKGGLRKDLMEALADMKPGCFRFQKLLCGAVGGIEGKRLGYCVKLLLRFLLSVLRHLELCFQRDKAHFFLGISLVVLRHNFSVAASHSLNVDSLVIRGGISVVGPEEGTDLHFLTGRRQLLKAIGSQFYNFTGAQFIKIIINADPFNTQNLLHCITEGSFNFRCWLFICSFNILDFRFWQGIAIHLSIWLDRNRINFSKVCRYHIIRQAFL